MDLSETTAAKSAQQNYDDFLGGITRTVTITDVTRGTPEQPVSIELAEYPGKPYKPNLSMRRVLLLAWGKDSTVYAGRKLKLFGNPDVVYGGKAVGGIEIEAVSDIDKPLTMSLTATRGRRRPFTVKPLPLERDWLAELTTAGDNLDAVTALGSAAKAAGAPTDVLAAIRAEYTRLKG
jgi:hypothetical protein